MRVLKIPKGNTKKSLSIDHFENKMVATIALKHSETQDELKELYEVGINGINKFKTRFANNADKFERFSAWWIRQEILKKKNNL